MQYWIRRLIAALGLSMFLLSASARAQCDFIEVWVDPDQGENLLPAPLPSGQEVEPVPVHINNPNVPTKTIQYAIDVAYKHLKRSYDETTLPDLQAVIHLMPGLYAPTSIGGNGEHFPIQMRDRVHLRGVGARRCVIRGVPVGHPDYNTQISDIFLPTLEGFAAPNWDQHEREVLIDYTKSGRFSADLSSAPPYIAPWACDASLPETMELIDGVTFQGGDVQVRFGFDPERPVPLSGRISNCLFDMRSGYQVKAGLGTITVTGPQVGVLMTKSWLDNDPLHFPSLSVAGEGYLEQRVHLLGNTFVMSEFVQGSGWLFRSIDGSAAVVDATWPAHGPGGWIGDSQDPVYKGVGHPGLQNNLFRTYSGGADVDKITMATVGITADDAQLVGAPLGDTNAYCRDRCGSMTEFQGALDAQLKSIPVGSSPSGTVNYGATFCNGPIIEQLWYGSSQFPAPAPKLPAVPIWDGNGALGTSQYDPAFVGEYLRTVSPVHATYRDWRLLPGSALKDMGYWDVNDPDNEFLNTFSYPEASCEKLQVGLWDAEEYGSPRVIDGQPDIGFDEIHLAVIAGSYANDSLSHNRQSFLNPFAEDEQAVRFVILPLVAVNGQQFLLGWTLAFLSNEQVPGQPPDNGPAWTIPPGSLSTPTVVPSSPPGYNTIYTSHGNPLPWLQSFSIVLAFGNQSQWLNPQGALGQQAFSFYLIQLQNDDEGAGFASWVNSQPFVSKSGTPVLWGNMQPEFR